MYVQDKAMSTLYTHALGTEYFVGKKVLQKQVVGKFKVLKQAHCLEKSRDETNIYGKIVPYWLKNVNVLPVNLRFMVIKNTG